MNDKVIENINCVVCGKPSPSVLCDPCANQSKDILEPKVKIDEGSKIPSLYDVVELVEELEKIYLTISKQEVKIKEAKIESLDNLNNAQELLDEMFDEKRNSAPTGTNWSK